ncbi:MAG: peptide chain release factor 3, partial [Deltaproteobacteria bacterium]|nr:peptide chain release factor 3 [Deltaproteobacteria bacterium]
SEFSGLIFKIQANMNRAHRDRLAFVRICSGCFKRGMKVHHVRTGRDMRLANPTLFLAQERNLVEEAFAGDIIGVFDTGIFQIGDTLTEGSTFEFEKIPSFAPEHFSRLVSLDPMRRKQLSRGIEQLAQEGTVQLYLPPQGLAGEMILGAVGVLQMEVTKFRLENEYGVKVRLEPLDYQMARWVSSKDGSAVDLNALRKACSGLVVVDVKGRAVVLFEREWSVGFAQDRLSNVAFAETAQGVVVRDGHGKRR